MDVDPMSAQDALELDPRWTQVQRIAASPYFVKSARLVDFLNYVARETLQGRGAQLNQQEIGTHVFGRRPDYDPLEDNIVRSHATRLRQRLDAYYESEGQTDTLRISMMPGAYQLQFYDVAEAAEPTQAAQAQTGEAGQERTGIYFAFRGNLLAWVLVALLAATGTYAGYEWHVARMLAAGGRAEPQPASPASHAFWSEVFAAHRRTLIVPGDSTLVIYKNVVNTTVTLNEYENKSFLTQISRENGNAPSSVAISIVERRLTSLADLELTTRLLRIPEAVRTQPEIRFARDLQLADLKESNAIFIGAQTANPWLSIYQPQINFEILDKPVSNDTRRFSHVVNRTPRAGEQANYPANLEAMSGRAYGVIALVPSLDGKGMALVVEGTTIAGTEAASEFVSDSQQMETVLAPLYRKYRRIPPFEILLETTDLNGTAPKARLLAKRENQQP